MPNNGFFRPRHNAIHKMHSANPPYGFIKSLNFWDGISQRPTSPQKAPNQWANLAFSSLSLYHDVYATFTTPKPIKPWSGL